MIVWLTAWNDTSREGMLINRKLDGLIVLVATHSVVLARFQAGPVDSPGLVGFRWLHIGL